MNKERKKVLIIAYACEPGKTSEPGVGWNFANEISKFMDVTVLTRLNNKSNIESHQIINDIKFIYFDLPNTLLKYKKKIPYGIQLYYKLWQWRAYSYVKRSIEKKELNVDVMHHLTFGTTKNVPPIYKFKIPFIWGPIGGGDKIPFSFLKEMGFSAFFSESIYAFMHAMSKISPLTILSRNKANAIAFRTQSSSTNFPNDGCKNRFLISETAMSDFQYNGGEKPIGNFLKAICIGRIMHGKGYIYALRGFHWFLQNGGNGKLSFFGEGPQKEMLKRYVVDYKLDDFVEFKGYVANEIVKKYLSKTHVLLHPSFREGGSWAIMEAMSHGVPVVCLNTSGPKDMVTNACGLLIAMKSPMQVVKDIGQGLLDLTRDEKRYNQLSRNAAIRITEDYNWNKRGEQIKEVYNSVLGHEKINEK